MTHHLKCWPEYFQEITANKKRFELRRNDRNYMPGDSLHLEEWNPKNKAFTGRECIVDVPYLLKGSADTINFGLLPDFVCMSIILKAIL